MKVREGEQPKVILLLLAIILVIVLMAFTVIPKLTKKDAPAAANAGGTGTTPAAKAGEPAAAPDFAPLHQVFQRNEAAAGLDPFKGRGGGGTVASGGRDGTAQPPMGGGPTGPILGPATPEAGLGGWQIPPADGGPAEPAITSIIVRGAVYDPGSQDRSMAVIDTGGKVLSLKVGEEIAPSVTLHAVRENGVVLKIGDEQVFVEVGKTYPPQAQAG